MPTLMTVKNTSQLDPVHILSNQSKVFSEGSLLAPEPLIRNVSHEINAELAMIEVVRDREPVAQVVWHWLNLHEVLRSNPTGAH